MRGLDLPVKKLARDIIGLVEVALLITHFVYGVPGDWFLMAAATQIAAWTWDPRLQMQRTPTGRAVQDFRKYFISTLTLWPPCLLVGWIVEKIAEAQGTWLIKAFWLGLCLIVSVCGAFRRWHNAVVVSDKGE